MTLKEAIKATLQDIAATDDIVDLALIDNRLDGTDDYEPENAEQVARCTIDVLQSVLSAQDIVEGGMSISNRFTNIPIRINFIAKKWGFKDVLAEMNPSIKSVNRW